MLGMCANAQLVYPFIHRASALPGADPARVAAWSVREGMCRCAWVVTEEATGKRLRVMRRDGLRVRGGEWRRETRTRASGRTEAGCALEGRLVPSAWLAGVRHTKAVSRDGAHSTDRQSPPNAGSNAVTANVRTRSQG